MELTNRDFKQLRQEYRKAKDNKDFCIVKNKLENIMYELNSKK